MVTAAEPHWWGAGFSYFAEVVAADPALRADIQTARSLGVSLRRYHGWEPRTITTRQRDRTITVREPEYDAWEQAIQAAYDAWQAGLCPDCGEPLNESLWDAEADHHPTYLAGYAECRACEVLEITVNKQAQDDYRQSERNNFPVATHHRRWQVTRVDKPIE